MAYTPINWDEATDVDATKLDNMEKGIQQNESNIASNDNDIASNDNDIANIVNDINSIDIHTGTGYLRAGENTVNLPFTADQVLIFAYNRNSGRGDFPMTFKKNTSVSSFNLHESSHYSYIAFKLP